MKEDSFRQWLLDVKKYDSGTIGSRISNCLRVENYEGDLDEYYSKDACQQLLNKLAYSTEDKRNKAQPKHNVPINGDVLKGSASLKQAVRRYVEYRQYERNPLVEQIMEKTDKIIKDNKHSTAISKREWPKWELPDENEMYELAQISMRYVRFLNSKIVELIVEDNQKYDKEWRDKLLGNNINPDLYLWNGSCCCFPGVRRYAGSKEIAEFHKHKEAGTIFDAISLDDNDFPKQIWSFIFRGTHFNKFGPLNYSLAHLIDHKKKNNRMVKELETDKKDLSPLYGLYTCPSNTVFIPDSLLKPTDFNAKLRTLLFQKAEDLYKNCCNILPDYLKIPQNDENDRWNIKNFKWADCVGMTANVELFLEFRNKKMNDLLK
jgi:hypothetical protein